MYLSASLQFYRDAREPYKWLKMRLSKSVKEFHIAFHGILETQHQPSVSESANRFSPCVVAKLSSLARPDSEWAPSQGRQTAGRQTCSHLEHHWLRVTAAAGSHPHSVSLGAVGFLGVLEGETETHLKQKLVVICKINPLNCRIMHKPVNR